MERDLRRGDGTPWGAILSSLAAVLYGASPIDVIPDVILILGWMDDAVAVPTFLMFAWIFYARHRKAAKLRRKSEIVDVHPSEPLIPDSYDSARA
jgi:uncharacterized membrane protein YkvA (DUF1232 family)